MMRLYTRDEWKRIVRFAATRPFVELRLLPTRIQMLVRKLPETSLDGVIPDVESVTVRPPITEDIGLPPYTKSLRNLTHDDFSPLASIALYLRPRVVVEFGTSYGNLTANLCRLCPQARVITVNALPEDQTGNLSTHKLSTSEIGRVYRQHGYAKRVEQVLANTRRVSMAEILDGDEIDFAVIDACHDPDYVASDFLKIAEHVRPGGIVMLHDTNPSLTGGTYGSYIGCLNLMDRGYSMKHLSDTWWGIWRREFAREHSEDRIDANVRLVSLP